MERGGLKEQWEQRKVWENEFDEINACDKPVNLRSTIYEKVTSAVLAPSIEPGLKNLHHPCSPNPVVLCEAVCILLTYQH